MLDPEQKFVTNTLTRTHVAEYCREYTDDSEDRPDDWVSITDDDDRLTDELCEEFASLFGDIECENGYDYVEACIEEIMDGFLPKLGWVPKPKPEPERESRKLQLEQLQHPDLVRQVLVLETVLADLRAQYGIDVS